MTLAVVITFNPEIDGLRKLLVALQPQVGKIQLVDNASANLAELAHLASSLAGVTLLRLPQNLGVGAALNRGIAAASPFDAVLLMDQDSVPSPTMVDDLQRGLQELTCAGEAVAAIGPRFLDPSNGHLSQHAVFAGWRVGRVACRSTAHPVAVDFLITSGALIPRTSLDAIGPFSEELFIDHVDTEWILRAKARGYRAFGDCKALMTHSLGEYRRRIWFGRWREVAIHKPFRYYYIFRNSAWLRSQPHACAAWRRTDITRLLQILTFMALFHPQRWSVLAMAWRGLRDAAAARMGRRDFNRLR